MSDTLNLRRQYLDHFGNMVLQTADSDGIIVWHKFGNNTAVGTTEEDIWLSGGKEVLPTSGVTMWAACTDNVNGVGQVMKVVGLDENWAPYTANVTLTGQTPAQIGNANGWTRIFRVNQVSAEPDPVGDVWIAEDDTDFTAGVPQTASNKHAFVDYTNAAQQSEKCMLTVPAGYSALIYQCAADIQAASGGAARSAEVFIEVQELALGATVASPSWAPWRRVFEFELEAPQQPHVDIDFHFPMGPFGELTNIHMRAEATASSDIDADMLVIFVKDKN